jgi:hypothetical protein
MPYKGLRHPLVLHAHKLIKKYTYIHTYYGGNVTAPYGSPKLRSRLHFGHNQEGRSRSLYGHVMALGEKKLFQQLSKRRTDNSTTYVTMQCLPVTRPH